MRLTQTRFPEMRWLRGKASFREGLIILDAGSAREYEPMALNADEPVLAFELSAVARPQDAVDFARRFGLLRHGPGADALREPWPEWEAEAATLRNILRFYAYVNQALVGDEDAMTYVRDLGTRAFDGYFDAPARNDDEALGQASLVIADGVSEGMADVGAAVLAQRDVGAPDGSRGPVGQFAMMARATDLLGFAYYGLALWLSGSAPARVCEGCGRVFAVKDPRQRFHDPRCNQRARYRRFADRKEGAE